MVIRGDGAVTWLESSAPPVGLFADTVYETQVVELCTGDLLFACTDGVVEGTNSAGEEWGVEGLLAAVKRCSVLQPERIVEAAFAALDEFSGTTKAMTQPSSLPSFADGTGRSFVPAIGEDSQCPVSSFQIQTWSVIPSFLGNRPGSDPERFHKRDERGDDRGPDSLAALPLQPEHQQVIRLRGPDVREPAASVGPDPAEAGQVTQVIGRIRSSIIRALERVVHIPPKNELRPFVNRPLL